MVMLRPAHNPIAGKMNATRCLLRRQTGSQREPCPPFQNVRTVCDVRTPKRGGVCRAATDFDCAAVTLRGGNAVMFERFRRLTLRSATGFSQRDRRHQMQANRAAARQSPPFSVVSPVWFAQLPYTMVNWTLLSMMPALMA